LAWLAQIKVERNAARDKGITLKGSTASDQLKKLSDFHYSLCMTRLLRRFVSITDPRAPCGYRRRGAPERSTSTSAVLGETTGKK